MIRNSENSLSFIISAMFTAAFLSTAPSGMITAATGPQPETVQNTINGIRTSGWSSSGQTAFPDAPQAPQPVAKPGSAKNTPPINDSQFKKVLEAIDALGADVRINSQITAALGLSRPGEVLTLRQYGTPDELGTIHTINRLPDDKGYLLGENQKGVMLRIYMTDKDLNLTAAVSQKHGEALIVMPIPAAMQGLKNEWTFWAKAADEP